MGEPLRFEHIGYTAIISKLDGYHATSSAHVCSPVHSDAGRNEPGNHGGPVFRFGRQGYAWSTSGRWCWTGGWREQSCIGSWRCRVSSREREICRSPTNGVGKDGIGFITYLHLFARQAISSERCLVDANDRTAITISSAYPIYPSSSQLQTPLPHRSLDETSETLRDRLTSHQVESFYHRRYIFD